MSAPEDIRGPVIVWENYGYEGWQPKSFATFKEALMSHRFSSDFVVTSLVDFEVVSVTSGDHQ